jgi:hypothetical protein
MPDDAGTVTLDENKTDTPRSWPLDPGVVRALRVWKRLHGGKGPFSDLDVGHLGEWQREALIKAGVDRRSSSSRATGASTTVPTTLARPS